MVTACTMHSQDLNDSANTTRTFKPVFYGELEGKVCYCFDTETTRDIVKSVVIAKDCDTAQVIAEVVNLKKDSLIATLKSSLDNQKILSNGIQTLGDEKLKLCVDENTSLKKIVIKKERVISIYKAVVIAVIVIFTVNALGG